MHTRLCAAQYEVNAIGAVAVCQRTFPRDIRLRHCDDAIRREPVEADGISAREIKVIIHHGIVGGIDRAGFGVVEIILR